MSRTKDPRRRVDGLLDPNASDSADTDGFSAKEAEAIENEDEEAEEEEEEEEEEEDDGAAQASANAAQLEALKRASLEKFSQISEWFDKMRRAFEKEGYKSKAYLKAQETIQTELMTIRFTARTVERLCDTLRAQVDEVRQVERQILHIVVDKCGIRARNSSRASRAARPISTGPRRSWPKAIRTRGAVA